MTAPQQLADELELETCQAIVTTAAQAIDAELPGHATDLRLADNPTVIGRQITIDATEKGGLLNRCRVAVLDPAMAPEGELVRIEYEHEKAGASGPQRVYSAQSVRKRAGNLILMENFLATDAQHLREEDFRPIHSEAYGRTTVLATLQEWTHFRAWQIQELKKK